MDTNLRRNDHTASSTSQQGQFAGTVAADPRAIAHLPYLREVAAGPPRMSLGTLLIERVVMPVAILSVVLAIGIWMMDHFKLPVGPATLI